ncbi:Nif3-like dinuclear metal center hexameric protein [Halotalea alkalilenta]|uniref:Nif3-like dinuclear metal center hexameric protein n=1 Tax=Halotalea alkalilenta TaxID=376489 RepID=UPI000485846A|nr:Nif3-like dinuclear metal center hexameric protein [Halotalea alkalilenta]
MADRDAMIEAMSRELAADRFKDYTLNGLQVEGKSGIKRVMSGVTACQALLDQAVEWEADLLLVHHGYFWKSEPVGVVGIKRRRLATLLEHRINLVAWHLPLDAHPRLGNNALLGERMGWRVERALDGELGTGLLYSGRADRILDHCGFAARLEQRLGRAPLVIQGHDRPLERICWCTGGAQDMIEAAHAGGADAFVSGEISERTTHLARELGISYFAAGHHATERDGIRALGEWLASGFDIEHRFVDIDNPV